MPRCPQSAGKLQTTIEDLILLAAASAWQLTLARLAIDLMHAVFSHSQLYTALSKFRHRSHAMIHLRPDESTTINVTFNELLL